MPGQRAWQSNRLQTTLFHVCLVLIPIQLVLCECDKCGFERTDLKQIFLAPLFVSAANEILGTGGLVLKNLIGSWSMRWRDTGKDKEVCLFHCCHPAQPKFEP